MQSPIPPIKAEFQAEKLLEQALRAHGWRVARHPKIPPYEPDFLIRKARQLFIVEVKAASEARPDRVIPALSHAVLQAQAYARGHGKARPLAVIGIPEAPRSLLRHLEVFVRDVVGDVHIGVVANDGFRRFYGGGFEELNVEPSGSLSDPDAVRHRRPHLFSDLNQWMIKILLAPEIPERMLSAPRQRYRNVSELARAAGVSIMSAYRFQEQLLEEGFVDKSSGYLRLVRRPELFRRWQAEALRSMPRDLPMSFLIRGNADEQLRKLVSSQEACLALFSAADALKLGHVRGVPPHVHVRNVSEYWLRHSNDLFPAPERPDVILRHAPAPESIFRGMVNQRGIQVADVIQVWLDVSAHSSRGPEQAALIYRRVLKPAVEGADK